MHSPSPAASTEVAAVLRSAALDENPSVTTSSGPPIAVESIAIGWASSEPPNASADVAMRRRTTAGSSEVQATSSSPNANQVSAVDSACGHTPY